MMRLHFGIIFAALMLFPLPGRAEEYFVKPGGLSRIDNASIYDIAQDRSGAIWLNTSYGVIRYNGNNTETLTEPLAHRNFASEPHSDTLYCRDLKNVYRIDARRRSVTRIPTGSFDVRHGSLAVRNGVLWAADSEGIWVFRDDSLVIWKGVPEKAGDFVLIENTANHGLICADISGKLFCVEQDKGRLAYFADVSDRVHALFEDSSARIWAGLENGGIVRFSEDLIRETSFTPAYPKSAPAKRVRTFCQASDGSVIAGSLNGLFIIDSEDSCHPLRSYTPDGHAICSLLRDSAENIWIGTFYSGVFLCERDVSPFERISESEFRLVNALSCDSRGTVWAAMDGYGFLRINSDGQCSPVAGAPAGAKFKSAYYDSLSEAIWLGEYMNTLKRYDIRSGQWSEIPFDTRYGEVSVFGIGSIAPELWLYSSDYIYLFNPAEENVISRRLSGFEGRAQVILPMENGDVWIGGPGLFKYRDGSVSKVLDLGGSICFDMVRDSTGIWIGTSSGLMLISPQGQILKKYSGGSIALADNMAYRLALLEEGKLLIGTNSGITIFDPCSSRCYNYSRRNGLPLSSVQEGCILPMQDGKYWIGGTDGIVCFDSKSGRLPSYTASLSFDNILVEGKSVVQMPQRLRYNSNNISITVCDSDYSGIVPSFYECRLLRDEKEWKRFEIGQPLVYLHLHPGKYTFQTRALHSVNDEEGYAGMSLSFRVLYPWWWSPVSWVVYLIMLALFIKWQYTFISEYRARRRSRETDDILKIAATSKDKMFMSSVLDAVNKHLGEPEFNVEELSSSLNISYSRLASRLKQITGYSPRDFVEFIRLRKASELLRRGDLNISQVADAVGFASSQYFATRFKKQFGKTPTEYILGK
ncbi:MAG: AraC family transcriptional regulator [Bacteroidales bacterium]|nr:AraC family transcriptional regulator [Bacteroidales bacterium]